MHFIVDHMFPRDLALFFKSKGHDATTVSRLGLKGGTDAAIWDYAEAKSYVVVSQDSDFVPLANNSLRAQLVHFRGGNLSVAQLLATFEMHFPVILEALESGERIIEFK